MGSYLCISLWPTEYLGLLYVRGREDHCGSGGKGEEAGDWPREGDHDSGVTVLNVTASPKGWHGRDI